MLEQLTEASAEMAFSAAEKELRLPSSTRHGTASSPRRKLTSSRLPIIMLLKSFLGAFGTVTRS